jgi:hypothetical protein
VPLGLSSRVMATLLNFQHISGYYEKTHNNEFPPEILPSNKSYGSYDILKVSAEMNDFFLRYWIPKNGLYSKFL